MAKEQDKREDELAKFLMSADAFTRDEVGTALGYDMKTAAGRRSFGILQTKVLESLALKGRSFKVARGGGGIYVLDNDGDSIIRRSATKSKTARKRLRRSVSMLAGVDRAGLSPESARRFEQAQRRAMLTYDVATRASRKRAFAMFETDDSADLIKQATPVRVTDIISKGKHHG